MEKSEDAYQHRKQNPSPHRKAPQITSKTYVVDALLCSLDQLLIFYFILKKKASITREKVYPFSNRFL